MSSMGDLVHHAYNSTTALPCKALASCVPGMIRSFHVACELITVVRQGELLAIFNGSTQRLAVSAPESGSHKHFELSHLLAESSG